MKKKKGFTLVELLAVIVILAVILIIAMPKISDVIKNSKEASLETTAKLIASQAEKKYTENQILDGSAAIKCSDVAKISANDYESCNITFDSKGNAKVSIVGKGKFEGMAVCNANKNSASISSDCSTNTNYFSYEVLEQKTYNVEVENIDKCKTYVLNDDGISEEQATALCNGGSITVEEQTFSLKDVVSQGEIPSSDYETAGLKVEIIDSIKITGYNIEGGTDVVIPSQIDGKTVVAIGDYAFTKNGVIPTGTAYNNDYKVSLLSYNSNNNYVVKPLKEVVVEGLEITSVVIPNTVTSIGTRAFEGNNLTNVTIPSNVTTIEDNAFKNNPNIVITNNSGIENTVDVWYYICGTSVFINGNVIKIDDDK